MMHSMTCRAIEDCKLSTYATLQVNEPTSQIHALCASRTMQTITSARQHVSPSTSSSTRARTRESSPSRPFLGRNALGATLALVLAITPAPSIAAPAAPSYSGVDPSKSSLIQGLVEKSAQNKEKNDQARLDSFYRRDFRINRLVGGELLKEPCDPRDPEFGYKCRPLLPRLPQDRMFEETAREKTGFGTVFSAQEVDRAADDLVAQEAQRQDEELSLIEE